MTPTLKSLTFPPCLKKIAFQSIMAAILPNKLEPGRIYDEQGLTRVLRISKAPVREAFLGLATKGFQVNALTEKERCCYEDGS
jgi:hypothetical protein